MNAVVPFVVRCAHCREEKPAVEFYRSRNRPNGLHNRCKLCADEQNKRWRSENPEKTKKIIKNNNLLKYGITRAQYLKMFVDQGGVCAICSQLETTYDQKAGRVRDLYVDHDHKTGVVRGLLCRACNTSIAFFSEDLMILKKAIEYLELHTVKEPVDG